MSVCTWVTSHCEITVACAEAGVKGILCEKPMAVNLQEADRMIEACERNNVILLIGHQNRYAKHYQFAKQLIEQGEFGRLISIWTSSYRSFLDWGTHAINYTLFFAGEVDRVLGQFHPKEQFKEDHWERYLVDIAVAYLKFKSGAAAIYENDLQPSAMLKGPTMRIICEKGEINLRMERDGSVSYCIFDDGKWQSPAIEYEDPYHLEICDLIHCIQERKQPLASVAQTQGQTLCLTEVASAIARRWWQGVLTTTEGDLFLTQFLAHYRTQYLIVPVTERLEEAGQLCFRRPLQALDAIHLAVALQSQRQLSRLITPLTFVSSDDQPLSAAQTEGFSADNSLWHL